MQENQPIINNNVTEPTVPSVVAPQPVYDKPKTNNFLVILLSILLLISCLVAGFFVYQTQMLVKELTSLKSYPSPTAQVETMPVVEPVVSTDTTAGWKTYSGKIFTFRYPIEMSLKRQDIEDPSDSKNIGDMVQLSDGKYKLQISSNFNGGWGGNPCLTIKDKKIAGLDSQVMYFGKVESETDICKEGFSGLVALIGNKTFEHPYPILIELQPTDVEGLVEISFFDQIISTFNIVN